MFLQHNTKFKTMFFIPPEQKATYIMEEHTHLYLFRSSPPCLQTQILQSFSQFVFFGQPQNIIVKLQGIQHSQINSDCNCRCAFFYSGHSQQRTGGTFCNLSTLRFLRRRANSICSPTIDIFCTNFRGSLVPIVFFVISLSI